MNALANDLQAGFGILWYEIESVLGRGGFGITYLAKDNNLGQLVAIKEYLPHEFAARSGDSTVQPVSVEQADVFSWGLERFMSEAQTLAKFKHPNIVRVLSVFKHNNTGYMVMEYEQGQDLSDLYKQKKQLTQKELENIYYPIIDGLASVHKEGFIHRDIKPANIYIRTDGSPVLIDFGAARQAVGTKTKTLTSMLSIGYAPFEQYNDAPGKQGPWTDIYALGASMHQGITGQKPIESTIRGMALLHDEPDPYEPLSTVSKPAGYSHAFLRAIDQALMLQVHDRPQTLEDFMGMLKGEITLPDLPAAPEKVTDSTVMREKTIVRPRKQKFSGAEVTQPDPVITKTVSIKPEQHEPKDSKETTASETSPPPRQGFLSKPNILIAVVAIIGAAILTLLLLPGQETPADLKQQKIQSLTEIAQQKIRAGQYYDNTGQGALSAYQQILNIDPGNTDAKNGIDNVGRLILNDAEKFIDNKDFAKADENLKIINKFIPELPGFKEAQLKFSNQLTIEKKFKQLEIFLSKANTAMSKGEIYAPEQQSAYFYYQNALKIDPDNVSAKLGLYDISDKLIMDAQTELDNKNFAHAQKLITLAETINPDKPAIKNLRVQLQKTGELEDILAKADQAYSANRYTWPRDDNAYDLYKQALTLSPANLQAQSRLDEMADFYANRTSSFTRSGNIPGAKQNLNILEQYFPEYSGLSSLKNQISQKQAQLNAAKNDTNVSSSISKKLIPVGINQKQDDYQVVQDLVGQFITTFKARDMGGMLKVSQLNTQQQGLYASIFKSYKSLNIIVVPNSFKLSKSDGTANVKFEITDLVDTKGNPVITSANWTKIEMKISKKNGTWLKAEII